MSDNTQIGWTDASWPPVTGCTHISDGCDHCYAATLTSGRLKHLPAYEGLAEGGRFNGQVRLQPDRLDWPQHWRKPRKIFVSDMADQFHAGVPDEYIARVWQVMATCPQHTFQVPTKRHARMRAWVSRCTVSPGGWITHNGSDPAACGGNGIIVGHPYEPEHVVYGRRGGNRRVIPASGGWPLPNVWCGVSAENEKWFDIRTEALLDTPAAVRFVSAEPLLGPIRMRSTLLVGAALDPKPGINWMIVGGESGPGHRPMDIGWLESIVSQCRDAGVPVFVKQDSGPRAGQQGRIPDDLWIHEFPGDVPAVSAA